jgi:hypothetical protein
MQERGVPAARTQGLLQAGASAKIGFASTGLFAIL